MILIESQAAALKAIATLEDEIRNALAGNLDTTTKLLLRTYDQRLNRIVKDMKDLHDRYFQGEDATLSAAKRYQLDKQVELIVKRETRQLDAELNAMLKKSILRQYETSMERWTWALDQTTPPNITPEFGMPPDMILSTILNTTWRGNMFSQELGVITDETALQIQKIFNDAMLNGDGAYDLGRRIRDQVGIDEDERLATRPLASKAKWRADMIARDQMMRVGNLAQERVYDLNKDLIADKQWATRPANQYLHGRRRLCDYCEERRDLGVAKVTAIAAAQGLPVNPPIHPMCSCIWLMIPKPWSELMDRDTALKLKFTDEGNTRAQDFAAWKRDFLNGN